MARAIEERRSIVENFYSSPAAAAKVQLFEGANFKGNMCELYIEKGKTVIVKDSLCREVTTSRSVKVVNFERGNQFCLSNTDHSRQRCVSGDYKGNFEIANFDLGSPLPSGLKRSAKGYPMNGSVTEMSYKKTDETFVRLYGGDNYTSLLCTVTVGQGSAKTPNTERQCPSNVGRARSAQVIGFDGSKLCFVNADATRKHCYTGDYRGDFGIANFDQYPLVLPNGLKATRGGYMNGNVRLISKGVE
ncbi:hypothetical protein [Pseudomonas sp. Teo4]|uniref:hypothetical protein n=1 Tax=Pseudomonas sp. Teo4 TaxID=3064528 RepID=UPI002ACB0F64|nr:hypothetical protein [Pseudomonas sp. Teo4]